MENHFIQMLCAVQSCITTLYFILAIYNVGTLKNGGQTVIRLQLAPEVADTLPNF